MSHSHKRHHYVTDGSKGKKRGGRPMKNYANKTVRHKEDIPIRQRGAYKKYFPSWDICDYKNLWTIEDAIKDWREEETQYPQIKKYWVYNPVSKTATIRWNEELGGPLHKHYKTLENFLNQVKKDSYRK